MLFVECEWSFRIVFFVKYELYILMNCILSMVSVWFFKLFLVLVQKQIMLILYMILFITLMSYQSIKDGIIVQSKALFDIMRK